MSDLVYQETCKDCAGPGPSCPTIHPKSGFCCTRPLGHAGQHVACSATHGVAKWEGLAGRIAMSAAPDGAGPEAELGDPAALPVAPEEARAMLAPKRRHRLPATPENEAARAKARERVRAWRAAKKAAPHE